MYIVTTTEIGLVLMLPSVVRVPIDRIAHHVRAARMLSRLITDLECARLCLRAREDPRHTWTSPSVVIRTAAAVRPPACPERISQCNARPHTCYFLVADVRRTRLCPSSPELERVSTMTLPVEGRRKEKGARCEDDAASLRPGRSLTNIDRRTIGEVYLRSLCGTQDDRLPRLRASRPVIEVCSAGARLQPAIVPEG